MPRIFREWWFWGLVAVGVVIYLRQNSGGSDVHGTVTLDGPLVIKKAGT